MCLPDIGSQGSEFLIDLIDSAILLGQGVDVVSDGVGVLPHQSGHGVGVVLELGKLGVADPVSEAGVCAAEVVLIGEQCERVFLRDLYQY